MVDHLGSAEAALANAYWDFLIIIIIVVVVDIFSGGSRSILWPPTPQ
jgi:hypothetical protein